MKFLIIYLIVVLFHLWHAIGNAQQCLHTEKGEDTGTPFRDDSNSPTLPTGSQAIIETYMFHCCGWITEWRAYVKPGGRTRYNISFQVWRPAVSQAAGCFTLVGENKFVNIMLNGKEVKVSPSSGIIHFQEGDVVGYYLTRLNGNRNEGGIQLETMDSDYRNDVIWYNISNNNPVTSIPENRPFCTGPGSLLPTSTRAAPAISVAFSTSTCSNMPPPSTELNSNNGRKSDAPFVILGVLFVFLFMIAIVTTVTIFVLIQMKNTYNKKSERSMSNPAYNLNESDNTKGTALLDGHAYQTVDEVGTNAPVKQCGSSAVKDPNIPESFVGIYSLYSPPEASSRTGQFSSNVYCAVNNGLNMYDKEKGYSVIRAECSQTTDASDKNLDSATYDYACTGSKLETLTLHVVESPGLIVPNQKERTKVTSTNNENYSKLNFFEDVPTYWAPASTSGDLYDQLSSRKFREIPRKQVTSLQHLGSGQFGTVSKALWEVSGDSIFMAVKKLRETASYSTQKVKLLQEAAIMGQFHHTNVVKLYGMMTIGEPLAVCIEYMDNGDLEDYLSAFDIKRDSPPREYKDMTYFFVQGATDIASGMKYLSSKAFVHRDLAARNILLNNSMTCKIGDFGMARNLMDDTYYILKDQRAIPVKWTAPEALFFKKYSSDSDVWSFGMLLFEIWSLGKRPFPSVENSKVPDILKTGHCQAPPPGCPRAMYQLMVDCWNPIHDRRPKFTDICQYLQQPINKLLYWSPQDNSVSEHASELGSKIEDGQELYKDLQNRYKSTSDKHAYFK